VLLRELGAGGGGGEDMSAGCFKSNSRKGHSREGRRVAKGTQQFTRDGEIQLNNYMGFRLKNIED